MTEVRIGGDALSAVTLSAFIHGEGDIYVASCPELGTVSQGRTIDEALTNLREATELFVEEVGLPEHVAPAFLTTFNLDAPRAAAA